VAMLRDCAAGEAATAHAIALALFARGRTDAAVDELRKFTSEHRRHVGGWLAFADVLRRAGREIGAAVAARRAHQLDPADRHVRIMFCRSLLWTGCAGEAMHVAADLAEHLTTDPDAAICVAETTRRLAAHTPFARQLAVAIRGSRLPRVRLAAGELLAAVGDTAAAAAELEEAWASLTADDTHRIACEIALARAPLTGGGELWYSRALDRARLLLPHACAAAHAFAGIAADALGDAALARCEYGAALRASVPWPLRARVLAGLRGLG
jgi:tetratricopeptide (TPR) repeat protein